MGLPHNSEVIKERIQEVTNELTTHIIRKLFNLFIDRAVKYVVVDRYYVEI